MKPATAIAIAALLPVVAACAALLGIEEEPLRAQDGGPLEEPRDVADNVDRIERDGCVPRGPSFCGAQCPIPDFCDDFEQEDGAALEHWQGIAGFGNQQADGGVLAIIDDDAGAPTRTLQAFAAANQDASEAAVVLHQLATKRSDVLGLRLRFKGAMRALSFDGGDVADRYAYVFAFGDIAHNAGLAAVYFETTPTTLDFRLVRTQLVDLSTSTPFLTLGGVGKEEMGASRPEVEIEVGPVALLRARQHACAGLDADGGDAGGDGLWLWAKLFVEKCLPLDAELASADWLGRIGILAGVYVNAGGTAETRVDDVAVSFLP